MKLTLFIIYHLSFILAAAAQSGPMFDPAFLAALPTNATASSSNPYTGELGLWLLNEGSGTTANDTSGHGSNGTLSGASFVAGSCSFTAASHNYISFPNIIQNAPFSLSAWVYWTGSGNNGIFGCWNNNANPDFRVDAGGGLELMSASVASLGTSSGTVTASTWTQVGVTYDGTTTKFYINGAASGTANSPQPFYSPLNCIGSGNDGGLDNWSGNIKYAAIWSSVLTGTQMLAIYNYGTP